MQNVLVDEFIITISAFLEEHSEKYTKLERAKMIFQMNPVSAKFAFLLK